MSGSAIGGNNVFPSLEDIAQLFRSRINDDFAGANNIPGEGMIATDSAPFMVPFMNSAFEDVYSDLRIAEDPELIFDNYVVENLPVVNGPYGVGSPAPETQVYLGIAGFFDGTVMHPEFKLPIYARNITRVWERQSGSANNFTPMSNVTYLSPIAQTGALCVWEWRQNAVWMPGAIEPRDIRLRGTLAFVDFVGNSSNLNFPTTYFPIVDSKRAVVANMQMQYADRFAPEQAPSMEARYTKSIFRLRQEITRRAQNAPVARSEFAPDTESFGLASQL